MHINRTLCFRTVFLSLFAASFSLPAHAGPIIGTFDGTRATTANVALGFFSLQARAQLAANVPGYSFALDLFLTDDFLSSIDMLLITSSKDSFSGIQPLSVNEQQSLFRFVQNGGSAFLIADARRAAAAQSMVAPFGMTMTSTTSNVIGNALPTDPTHPVLDGPFGTTTAIPIWGSSAFANLGPYAHSLANQTATGLSYMAVIEEHALGPHSGRVVFLSETKNVEDGGSGLGLAENQVLFNNSVHFLLVPEPSGVVLAVIALALVGMVVVRGTMVAHLLPGMRSRMTAARGPLVGVLVAGGLLLCPPSPAKAGPIIGTFDGTRSTTANIANGFFAFQARASLASHYPGYSFATDLILTDSFLSGIDLLLITSSKSGNIPIILSANEQESLYNYVLGGGSALLLADGQFGLLPGAQSMITPFGLTIGNQQTALSHSYPVDVTHPTIDGPFGEVSMINTQTYSYFTNLGPYAHAIANIDIANMPSIAVIEEHALGPLSGRVVFISAIDEFKDQGTGRFLDNETFFLNTVQFLLPEPSGVVLAGMALSALTLAAIRRRAKA